MPVERRRVLPGDPEDEHSRYIEAEVEVAGGGRGSRGGQAQAGGGRLYLPNGDPAPGPKSLVKAG
jgi:exodeoxyribonuclease-3